MSRIVPLAECKYVECTECGRGVFAEPGGRMVATGLCSPCVMFPDRHDRGLNPHGVSPGQVWQDLDPRRSWRKVKVVEVDLGGDRARVFDGRRRSWVKLANFTTVKGRGYKKVA